ncbi:MAG: DUF6443 domain-containing protein, partial [Bacteroides sp.]|nr:DUF6443 domain-containing protein [Bacteroides sp.]
MKRISIYIILCLMAIYSQAQSTKQNYRHTRTMLNEAGTSFLDHIEYYDGIGRPYLTVEKGITPDKKNLAHRIVLDGMGREIQQYIPTETDKDYLSADEWQSYYTGSKAMDNYFYKTVYECSTRNLITATHKPYYYWTSVPATTEYVLNTASGELSCRKYIINADGTPSPDGVYPAGSLQVIKSTDEDKRVSYTFTDKAGRILMTRQMSNTDTYYIYDDYGNLVYVLSPFYQASSNLDRYAYQYVYDDRNRCIEKKLPGCEPIQYVYDKEDNLIFSQDGEQRKNNPAEWTFYLYDKFKRLTVQGICRNTNTNSVKNLSVVCNRTSGGIDNCGYTSSFALTSPTIHLVTYYDNYDFLTLTGFSGDPKFTASTIDASGYETGSAARIYGSNNSFVYAVTHYDVSGNPVHTLSTNHLEGHEKVVSTYSFSGEPLTIETTHTAKGKTEQKELYTYIYDHANRNTKITHKLNTQPAVTLAEYTYTPKGFLGSRQFHGTSANKITYGYESVLWLNKIQSTQFTQDISHVSGSSLGDVAYNGNIRAISWKVGNESVTRNYGFRYDNYNRLTAAEYQENGGTNKDAFSVKISYYDLNGNISKIERRGKTSPTTNGVIDDLRMEYIGNQLSKVTDSAIDPTYEGNFNFVDGNKGTGIEYIWNKNGSLVQDYNKQIANISYNLLNL